VEWVSDGNKNKPKTVAKLTQRISV